MGTRTDLQIRSRCEQRVGALVDGKYVLQELLGFGTTGAVYRAHNRWAGRSCALKLFHYEGPDEQSLLRRFVREAKAANRVMRDGRPHPNVTAALDVGRDADTGRLFIVQELLQGMTLGKYLEALPERRLEPRAALDLLLPILDAVGAAHAAGIVHRDLKPENIFLAEEGEALVPKVLDFGIAKLLDDRMTPNAEVLGTPQYMAPESFRGSGDVDGRADLWAIGVILFEALSGRSPFASPTGHPVDALRRILSATPEHLMAEGLCEAPLWCALRRALTKDPALRYSTAAEMADALVDALEPVRALRVPPGATPAALREALYRSGEGDLLRGAVRASLPPGDDPSDDDAPELSLADDPARAWWSVSMHGAGFTADDVLAVLSMRELSRRVELHLVGVPLGDDGLAKLLHAGALSESVALTLRHTGITAAGAAMLAGSEQLANVVRLDLEDNDLGAAGVTSLAQSPHTAALRALSLVRTKLPPAAGVTLATATLLGRLHRLDLSQNALDDLSVRALGAGAFSPTLWLGLARNPLTPDLVAWALRELAPRMRRLVM
jgi:serine/threonine protein kinase